MSRINIDQFKGQFAASMDELARSEQVTKRELLALSRSLLNALHNGPEGLLGDIGYINRLIAVLTPVNKKVARLYFEAFSGFVFSEQTFTFVKKHGGTYEACKKNANELLADPHQNIWTWAERKVEVSAKEFDLAVAADFFKKFVKKAEKNSLNQKDVLKAILGTGVTVETIIELMGEMYNIEAEVK